MRKRREVLIFSFSFIDILATTIGVLLFIMLMAILNQSGITADSEMDEELKTARQKLANAEQSLHVAEQAFAKAWDDAQDARQHDSGGAQRPSRAATLAEEIRAAETQNMELERRMANARKSAANLQNDIEARRNALGSVDGTAMLPKVKGGSAAKPMHVDCRPDNLLILGDLNDPQGRLHTLCHLDNIKQPNSSFAQFVHRVKRTASQPGAQREVVVLWIRPGGSKVADHAIGVAREAGVAIGWEPADRDWVF